MPTVVVTRPQTQVPQSGCCSCLHTAFLSERVGVCKLAEVLFGGICLGLVFTYGTPIWLLLGPSYALFITSSAAAVIGATVALFSYLISAHTYRTVRSTVYEIVQNVVASILYISASVFLLIQTSVFLWPMYLIIPYFQAYPALMTAGVFGIASCLIHIYDAYHAYKSFKQ
ncbi:protein singles bar-like isoform X1 [Centruroides sculpturatus]|uniref:protein singles bar-like isoform X1 n=1 Tax=Centruroides sculpturatus TaxID=218467 RepID=UPI000C6E8757|nr:protein singles bar-like isoform X1 [Centruroides sculpturatus]